MYSVTLTEEVHISIKSFINSYRNTFLELFSDTGIFDETLIREHYIKSSESFQIEIFNLIEDHLKTEVVFWRKKISDNLFESISQVWNYRLFLQYSEDTKNQIRYLESIELHKK